MDLDGFRKKVLPEHTALLIIDMQRDYCCQGGVFDRRGFDIGPARDLAIGSTCSSTRPVRGCPT